MKRHYSVKFFVVILTFYLTLHFSVSLAQGLNTTSVDLVQAPVGTEGPPALVPETNRNQNSTNFHAGTKASMDSSFWTTFNKSIGPILVGGLVLLAAALSAMFFPGTMIKKNHAPHLWVQSLEPEMTTMNLELPDEGTGTGKNARKRLKEQVEHITKRAHHHFQVMQFFYLNYYMQLMLGAIFGGLTAIWLVLLTKTGWDTANPYLVSFFLTCTICTAFFIAFPSMCKMDENVAKNKALYLKYVSLLNEARTFAALGDCAREANATGQLSTPEFILHLDIEMKKANDIAVSFDPGKYPVYKISTERSG